MKKAEEQLEREQMLRVLKKASTATNWNNSGTGKEGRIHKEC
jgi:hypothetical protein